MSFKRKGSSQNIPLRREYKTGDYHGACKENGPYAYLLWILVFDDQHNQIGLMNLQVFIL